MIYYSTSARINRGMGSPLCGTRMYVSKMGALHACRLTKCWCWEPLQVSRRLPLATLYSSTAYASSGRTGCRKYLPIQFVLSSLTRFSVVPVFGAFALRNFNSDPKWLRDYQELRLRLKTSTLPTVPTVVVRRCTRVAPPLLYVAQLPYTQEFRFRNFIFFSPNFNQVASQRYWIRGYFFLSLYRA